MIIYRPRSGPSLRGAGTSTGVAPATAGLVAQLAAALSYLAPEDLPSGPDRSELVTPRRSMLDQLERRDPAGFGRRLDSGADAGADAGGDLGRYLAAERCA